MVVVEVRVKLECVAARPLQAGQAETVEAGGGGGRGRGGPRPHLLHQEAGVLLGDGGPTGALEAVR